MPTEKRAPHIAFIGHFTLVELAMLVAAALAALIGFAILFVALSMVGELSDPRGGVGTLAAFALPLLLGVFVVGSGFAFVGSYGFYLVLLHVKQRLGRNKVVTRDPNP